MTPKERLIERFKALCEKHGVDFVAGKIHSSPDSLKQVIAGTKLPSGKPRGIGPDIQQRLEKAFPGWSELEPGERAHAPPPIRKNFEDPERDTGWQVLQDLDALHPTDRDQWISELHRQAEKMREVVNAAREIERLRNMSSSTHTGSSGTMVQSPHSGQKKDKGAA